MGQLIADCIQQRVAPVKLLVLAICYCKLWWPVWRDLLGRCHGDGIDIRSASVHASGEMDFRGTLGVDRATPIGITAVQLEFKIDSPAEDAQLAKLVELTERYCVVLQTLVHPAALTTKLARIKRAKLAAFWNSEVQHRLEDRLQLI